MNPAGMLAAGLALGAVSRLLDLYTTCAWWAKEPGAAPKIIGAGIVLASALSSVVFFHGFRIYDVLIDGLLAYVLFFKKIER